MGVEKNATAEAESKSAFAKRLGVSPSYITKLVGKGLPLTADGRHVKVADALAWVRANINSRADEGRSAARPPVDLNDARIRLTLAQADIAEQNARKARRETVDREEARRAVRAFGRALRDLMLNFANRYGGSMAAELEIDPARLMAVLDARMREMLLEGLAVPAPYHKPTEPVMGDSE
ncbi:hypothetical protein SAMN05444389_1015 [Paracoccus solventivorans]|uniref:Phage DNA packaging protein, Nu1 subunit of terminase n=1 Tax=Paracoccus solventivorans TaxID=53463 RepID=A0A1M7CWV3_9RHOB|nr:hypothetical protein [Paracoccus solventivorans]SHL71627.1 hypothetical protein SAMN05444389_1015 [Paracoccus solventivorans]